MFERFTDRARRVLVLAQEEARLLEHGHIGTEHLLLGLIREGDGVAGRALESLGVGLEAVRQQAEDIAGRGRRAPSGRIPLTPPAKKTLEYALPEALRLGHSHIGTEHLLLGLLRAGDSVAVQILDRLDTDLTQVRQRTLRLIHDSSPDPAGSPRGLVPRPRTPEDVLDLRRRALAGRDPDGFAALFAPDAVLESPFAAPPVPSRIEGRESIRRIAEAQMASPQRITDIETVALHHTDDPEVIIAEIVTRGTEADGTAFAIPCVQVFRIRDGQIVSFRDYAGPAPR